MGFDTENVINCVKVRLHLYVAKTRTAIRNMI